MVLKILCIAVAAVLVLCGVCYAGVAIAHAKVFARVDKKDYNSRLYVVYDEDVDKERYPREEILIPSGENTLAGFVYGQNNTKGLVVVSPGHTDFSDIKLYEILPLVDAGFRVLCYDYTGCYGSTGECLGSYVQAVDDLDAVLRYVRQDEALSALPLCLYGHSLGAYASAAVLNNGYEVAAVVAASGFDTPLEQWNYSVKRSTGIFGGVLEPFAALYTHLTLGERERLSAMDGINAITAPVLVFSGTKDIFYGNESPIYLLQERYVNPNAAFVLFNEPAHNGHYDYFLTDAAVAYRQQVDAGEIDSVDKWLYSEHDPAVMERICAFFTDAVH